VEEIRDWYARQPWLCGFNYLPRSAVNFLEQWRRESFDAKTIDEELGWAEEIGFNTLRTNLHSLVWLNDAAGLRDRLDRFLGIAARRGMRSLVCLFDDCGFGGAEPVYGPQPDPVPGVHNSRAVASPGRARVRDRASWPALEGYVSDVIGHFADDERVLGWDLYNEPGNASVFSAGAAPADPPAHRLEFGAEDPLHPHSMALAREAFRWARRARPSQPLTSGAWDPRRREDDRTLVELSDLVSFHDYLPLDPLARHVEELAAHGRPLVCTEWLARGLGSRPETHLPFFRERRIGCYHWGLVRGRTQTHLPWPGLERFAPDAHRVWQHDLFEPDGAPYEPGEIALFRQMLRG
jgi:hypothetical protein